MSKLFVTLRKAHQERNREPALDGKVTELLWGQQEVNGGGKTLHRTRGRAKKEAADISKAEDVQGHVGERLVAFHDTKTSAVEQYRKLYVEIVRAGLERQLRTLLISSALEKEGKTTTALNLAITIAASGGEQSTLLVETDFRRPKVQKLLGTHPECGFTDYLLGDVEYAQIFTQTHIPGLTVVHAGRRVENPVALVHSEKMGQFFQAVKSETQYNYIILDSTPVMLTSETTGLMQHVDAAVLVVHAKKTPREMVAQAMETLGTENILGCVLNGIDPSDFSYYRYYSSSDYSHTGGNTQD